MKEPRNLINTITRLMPPPGYYLALSLLVALFILFLDANFRSVAIMQHMGIPVFIKNAAIMMSFLFMCAVFLATVMWLLELLFILVFRIAAQLFQKQKWEPEPAHVGEFSTFLFYFILVYVYLVYFKMFLGNFTINVKSTLLPVKVLLGVLLVLYVPLFRKRMIYSRLKDSIAGYIKAAKVVAIAAMILSIGSYIVDAIPGKPLPPSSSSKPNIIIISCDSLTATHMSLYGYSRKTTPRIDEIASDFHVFQRNIANCNFTYHALYGFLGRYPRIEGDLFCDALLPYLTDAGYRERVFISFVHMPPSFRKNFTKYVLISDFDRTPLARSLYVGRNRVNFQWLSALLSEDEGFLNLFIAYDLRDFGSIKKDRFPLPEYFHYTLETLKGRQGPMFIWTHVFEPHFPYKVWGGFQNPYGSHSLPDRYDGCIQYLDEYFGRFIDDLKKNGLYDNSIIILTADHGESFGETHGGWTGVGHGGDWMSEGVTHIPLLIHTPGQKSSKRIETFSEQVDIAPTIMDLIGEGIPQSMEGETLVPYMKDEKKLSRKLKLCVPTSFFDRNTHPLTEKPPSWTVIEEDMYNAFIYKYKIGWIQSYGRNPKNPGMMNVFKRFLYYGVYDMFTDPHEQKNLLNDGEKNTEKLLNEVYGNPVVKYYRGE